MLTRKRYSDTSVKPRKVGRPAGHIRQNGSDTRDTNSPITDRGQLKLLQKMVVELNTVFGFDFRWIAPKTTRGEGSFGYWQRIGKGDHMLAKPGIRPKHQDLHDIKIIYQTVRDYQESDERLFDRAMAVVGARAALDSAVFELLAEVRKRAGRKG